MASKHYALPLIIKALLPWMAMILKCGPWSIEALVATLKGHTDKITSLDINRDGTHIVSASLDGTIKLWDSENDRCIKNISAS